MWIKLWGRNRIIKRWSKRSRTTLCLIGPIVWTWSSSEIIDDRYVGEIYQRN